MLKVTWLGPAGMLLEDERHRVGKAPLLTDTSAGCTGTALAPGASLTLV